MINFRLFKLSTIILLCLIVSLGATGQQSALIGQITKGNGIVTNESQAKEVLRAGLSSSATISNLRILWVGGDENKYYLVGSVSGDKVTAKAIQLESDGILLRAVSGPGVEITCDGKNCSRCDIKLVKFKLYCICEKDNTPGVEGTCDMTSKFKITAW